MRIALLLLALTPTTGAHELPTMEASFGLIRQHAMAARAEIRDSKDANTARELEALASSVDRAASDAGRLRWEIRDIQRRAQRYDGGQPGRPGSDPFLRNDLNRLVWDLRRLADDAGSAERNAARLGQTVSKDPALVAPAQRLLAGARRLRSEADWLESDGRWAGSDLRRAGFTFEAWDVERYASETSRYSRSVENLAGQIVSKVLN